MRKDSIFKTNSKERRDMWQQVIEAAESHFENISQKRVAPILDKEVVLEAVNHFDLEQGLELEKWLPQVTQNLTDYVVHVDHPMYYGLYNPKPNFASIISDVLSATFNPQMAAWSHAPYPVEIENLLVRQVGERYGYGQNADGVFGAGGAEANMTAVLCAINHHFPNYAKEGLIGVQKQPTIYVSEQSHHSVVKAASNIGIGIRAIRHIPVNKDLTIRPDALTKIIRHDRQAGYHPFMVVGTLGATGPGTIDPLSELAIICQANELWFHVDGAWAGAVALFDSTRHMAAGIEESDSATFDIHKWLSVPMGTSMFVTRHTAVLNKAFRVTADYMPKDAEDLGVIDPYMHSLQWSRKFLGFRFYLSLLMYGWKGYEELIHQKIDLGNYLRKQLADNGWRIVNSTPLPVVCFDREDRAQDSGFCQKVCNQLIANGMTWLSLYPIHGQQVLRVCITNFETTERDIDRLINLLNEEL